MGSLTSQLIVKLTDQVSAPSKQAARSLREIGQAARSVNGVRIQSASLAETAIGVNRALGAVGMAGGLYMVKQAAQEAYLRAASFDRRMTRIGITADATDQAVRGASKAIHAIAQETATPIDKVVDGLDALIARGRSLDDAMGFLPSVARAAAASGSDVDDIAKTAEAIGSNFKISSRDMEKAFEILVAGGKAGNFELKDMARYLPALAPAAAAAGLKGAAGLEQLVAMLQVVQKGTGTAEEATASFNNILSKMESEETAKRFGKFGIDLRKEMARARKQGRNLLEVFEELSFKAVKGDLSKIPQLFSDMEFARGIRALLTYRGEWQKLAAEIRRDAPGAVARDLARATSDAQSSVDRLSNSWDRASRSFGRTLDAGGATSALDGFAAGAERAADSLDRLSATYREGGLSALFSGFWKGATQELRDHNAAWTELEKQIDRVRAKEEKALGESLRKEQKDVAEASQELYGDDRLQRSLDIPIAINEAQQRARRMAEDPVYKLEQDAAARRSSAEREVSDARDALELNRRLWGIKSPVGRAREKSGLERLRSAESELASLDQAFTGLRAARAAAESFKVPNLAINNPGNAVPPVLGGAAAWDFNGPAIGEKLVSALRIAGGQAEAEALSIRARLERALNISGSVNITPRVNAPAAPAAPGKGASLQMNNTFNVSVNGTTNPEQFADKAMRQVQRRLAQSRRAIFSDVGTRTA